jgi:hypothetical protein
MDDDDSTEASIRGLLDLPKRPLVQAEQIHHKIDGEDYKHTQAADSHTARVDVCEIAAAVVVKHEQEASEEQTVCRGEDEACDEKPLDEGGL